ncbi:glycosyltransferase family 4 protein [soil metagenome]
MNEATAPLKHVDTDGRPSILFASPMCSLDIGSGAAMSIQSLLASLAARGYRARVLEAQLFDSEHGGEQVVKAAEAAALEGHPVLHTVVSGVEHLMVRTSARLRLDMTAREQEVFIRCYRDELQRRRPDMVMLWGDMLLETTLMREARELGIPVVFYLVSGGYKSKDPFRDVSVIVTDTQATADLYRERLGLACIPVGKFIDQAAFKARQRNPTYITFINPAFEKGVNVFMPLARLATKEAPDIKFLVVQSRGRWAAALQALKYKPEDFPNVTILDHQPSMLPVYSVTKALLVPSVWHESGGRVVVEALMNGIPVLASAGAGPAELAGEAGVVFDLPACVKDNRQERAPEAVVRPWLDEIRRIRDVRQYYEELVVKAGKEALRHDLQRNTDRFVAAVEPAVKQAAAINKARLANQHPARASNSTEEVMS